MQPPCNVIGWPETTSTGLPLPSLNGKQSPRLCASGCDQLIRVPGGGFVFDPVQSGMDQTPVTWPSWIAMVELVPPDCVVHATWTFSHVGSRAICQV